MSKTSVESDVVWHHTTSHEDDFAFDSAMTGQACDFYDQKETDVLHSGQDYPCETLHSLVRCPLLIPRWRFRDEAARNNSSLF